MTIRQWLKQQGFTHAKAAKHLGMSTRRFQSLLYGTRKPTLLGALSIKERTEGAVCPIDWIEVAP